MKSPGALWREAGRGYPTDARRRARYLILLREYGYIYEREDGVTVHTEENPRPPVEQRQLA